MSRQAKKMIREAFRNATYSRDGYTCRGCGLRSTPERAEEELDAHHVTPRTEMPEGGYVAENGISLCKAPGGCHEKAEEFYRTGTAVPGYSPEDLYKKIGSTHSEALLASQRLAVRTACHDAAVAKLRG